MSPPDSGDIGRKRLVQPFRTSTPPPNGQRSSSGLIAPYSHSLGTHSGDKEAKQRPILDDKFSPAALDKKIGYAVNLASAVRGRLVAKKEVLLAESASHGISRAMSMRRNNLQDDQMSRNLAQKTDPPTTLITTLRERASSHLALAVMQ